MRVTARLALRFVAAITLISLVVLCFTQSNVAFQTLSDRLSTINPTKYTEHSSTSIPLELNTTQSIESVEQLWATWAKVYKSTRPNAAKVELMFNAANLAVSADDHSPRTQHREQVQALDSIPALQVAHSKFVSLLQSWPDHLATTAFNGTGVVIVGGGEYFGPAIISIHMLRRSGSNLPVEVFVADASEYEKKLCDEYLPKLGAKCLILSDMTQGFKITHYQLKSLAILSSSFQNVLYLDSDSIPLLKPETEIFATEPYMSTGLVIWPDFWISTESPSFYTVAGLGQMPSNLPKSSSEAGQLVIDKRKHIKTLLLAVYYNIYGPDYYYPLLSQGALGQGDKETFMAAAIVLGIPYHRVNIAVEAVNRDVDGAGQEKGSGMIQFNPSDSFPETNRDRKTITPRPAFLHANTPKMNAGHLVDEGDLISSAITHDALRLWGSQDEQMKKFGLDLEKAVWELIVQTGCELANVIREWTDRENLCRRLNEHWDAVF